MRRSLKDDTGRTCGRAIAQGRGMRAASPARDRKDASRYSSFSPAIRILGVGENGEGTARHTNDLRTASFGRTLLHLSMGLPEASFPSSPILPSISGSLEIWTSRRFRCILSQRPRRTVLKMDRNAEVS